MEDIQVGEYVRTMNGKIFKLKEFFKEGSIYSMVDENGLLCGNPRKVTKKHSPNIIDIIEVGDYVNNYRVEEIGETHIDKVKYLIDSLDRSIYEENIISILTHEQFEQMKYVVGDK